MRFLNLFDKKKKRTVLIVQCRLSSTRLPRKALLPLGGKCVLEWVLQSMKKVKVDKYYLAVDTESAPELEKFAKDYDYKFFAGSKEDVLDRFCKVIELSDADVVVRATADNPFLFYEAAQGLLDEYKDRSANSHIDYITWTGLPHGSGVEIFDAHSLLKASEMTSLEYDHEHVGPALYNHKESFVSLFIKAPKEFYYPSLRTTIDVPGDYRRAQAIVRFISGNEPVKEPYKVSQIIDALEESSVKYPMLLIPSTVKGHGTGHLRRCLDIAVKTGSDILISSDSSLSQTEELLSFAKENGLYDFQIVRSIENAEQYNLAVLDNFKTSSSFLQELSSKCPVVALDEGSLDDSDCIDYILDIIPSANEGRYVNLFEPGFIEVGKNKKDAIDKTAALKTALVVLGGEDPSCLTAPAAEVLAGCGLAVTAVTAVTASAVENKSVAVVSSITNLKDKLFEYDLVVTHYGLTAFEAVAAGCAVILLGTSSLHEQLSKKYG
nr:NTP transferase domain-containing protein [Treponema sp.]